MTSRFTVTVAIPTRNEESNIAGCLQAIAAQTHGDLDVVVVDGMSDDATVAAARRTSDDLGLPVRIIDNPRRGTSSNLNEALNAARGSVLVRVDARSRIQSDYVALVAEVLTTRPDVGVVGGRQVPIADTGSFAARAISRALGNRLTTGLSRYRLGGSSGPADTVWMGAFRVDDLRRLGGWEESLTVNEDYELNGRFRDTGLLVWFDARLSSTYVPRGSASAVTRQYLRYGVNKGHLLARGEQIAPRHLAVLAAPLVAGAAAVAVGRRFGAARTALLALGCAFAADAMGSSAPATVPVRLGAIGATILVDGAWWSGAVAGIAAERLGLGGQ